MEQLQGIVSLLQFSIYLLQQILYVILPGHPDWATKPQELVGLAYAQTPGC